TMQVELLNRRQWRTRIELANTIFDYIEAIYNRSRRHSAIQWHSPVNYEKAVAVPVVTRRNECQSASEAELNPGRFGLAIQFSIDLASDISFETVFRLIQASA